MPWPFINVSLQQKRFSSDCQVFSLPSFADVQQVSHHPEQHLGGADGTVVICRHLVANEVLALLGRQLFAFTKGINVDKVIDVLTPAETRLNKSNMEMYLTDIHHKLCLNDQV